jgi:hypothetical protein
LWADGTAPLLLARNAHCLAAFSTGTTASRKREYEAALSRDIPSYVLIAANVYSEYQTYLRNKGNEQIHYAHVDSVNIFHLIEDILTKPRNNPIHVFERFADIENWLREQWSGLFRELLRKASSQQQIAALSAQIEALAAINETLQRYLEAVVRRVSPDDASHLITTEREKLSEMEEISRLKRNQFYRRVLEGFHVDVRDYRLALVETETFGDFAKKIGDLARNHFVVEEIKSYEPKDIPRRDLNEARAIVGKPAFFPGPSDAS